MLTVVLAVALAVAGCVMIVRGLPMSTPTERSLLDLSSLPLSAAVGLMIWRVVGERGMLRNRPTGTGWPRLFLIGLGLVLLGVLGWVLVLTGLAPSWLGPASAQVLLWLGLGVWVLWVVADGRRRQRIVEWHLAEEDGD